MSLEDEMRTTLTREADARAVPSPDVAGLILRGRARRRRRNVVRLGVGVVATVLVGATAFGIVHLGPRADGELASEPSPSPRAGRGARRSATSSANSSTAAPPNRIASIIGTGIPLGPCSTMRPSTTTMPNIRLARTMSAPPIASSFLGFGSAVMRCAW